MDPFGKKKIAELEVLVRHLKKDKRTQRKNFFKSLRDTIDKGATEVIEFMNRDKELTKHPYMFVNSRGKILGYTKALETALGITKDVKGIHYLDVFHFEHEDQRETRESLKRYFSSQKKMSVPYDRKDKKKTRKLTITKEEPLYTGGIELNSLRSNRTFHAVAYVPIKVSSRKRKMRIPGLSKEDAEERAAHVNEVTMNLIVHHNWRSQEIDNYKVEHGENGLIKKYEALEKKAI